MDHLDETDSNVFLAVEMAQKILDDQKYEPKKEDFIDKIPETIPEGRFFLLHFEWTFSLQRTNP